MDVLEKQIDAIEGELRRAGAEHRCLQLLAKRSLSAASRASSRRSVTPRLQPMMLAGVSVRNELVQRLAYVVGDSEFAERVERALDAQLATLSLTLSEREAILAVLEDQPDGLEELRDRLRDRERRDAEGRSRDSL